LSVSACSASLHGLFYVHPFAACAADERFDNGESREDVEGSAMCASCAANLIGCHFRYGGLGLLRGHRTDYGAAFVARYRSLIPVRFDDQAPAAFRVSDIRVRDERIRWKRGHDQVIVVIAWHTSIIPRRTAPPRRGEEKAKLVHWFAVWPIGPIRPSSTTH
jgi:hypothetical protein